VRPFTTLTEGREIRQVQHDASCSVSPLGEDGSPAIPRREDLVLSILGSKAILHESQDLLLAW
jgi:hypothetical protein